MQSHSDNKTMSHTEHIHAYTQSGRKLTGKRQVPGFMWKARLLVFLCFLYGIRITNFPVSDSTAIPCSWGSHLYMMFKEWARANE